MSILQSIGRLFGRKQFKASVVMGKNPAATALKAVHVPSLGERIARAFSPSVSPRSLYSSMAYGSPAYTPTRSHRPSKCRGRCNRKNAARKAKARR